MPEKRGRGFAKGHVPKRGEHCPRCGAEVNPERMADHEAWCRERRPLARCTHRIPHADAWKCSDYVRTELGL